MPCVQVAVGLPLPSDSAGSEVLQCQQARVRGVGGQWGTRPHTLQRPLLSLSLEPEVVRVGCPSPSAKAASPPHTASLKGRRHPGLSIPRRPRRRGQRGQPQLASEAARLGGMSVGIWRRPAWSGRPSSRGHLESREDESASGWRTTGSSVLCGWRTAGSSVLCGGGRGAGRGGGGPGRPRVLTSSPSKPVRSQR